MLEHFIEIFEYLMKLSSERPITLFIDEFQDFFRVNKSIYSDMQRIWDIYSPTAKINLIVCGSIYSMMTKIFWVKANSGFDLFINTTICWKLRTMKE